MVAWWWVLASCGRDPEPERAEVSSARRPHELTVDCRGPADYAALVDAVHDAHDGDLITVAPCTYFGTVDLDGKSLRIVSSGGPEVTTIAATPGKAAVRAHAGEGVRSVVSGFTLTGGGGAGIPGGVDVEMASLRVEHAIVTGNGGSHAIHGRSADLVLADVRVEGNTSQDGATIDAQRGFLLLVDSQVTCGPDAHGVQLDHGSFLIDRSDVICDGADSLYNMHSTGRVQRSDLRGRLWWEGEDSGDEMVLETSWLHGGLLVQQGTLQLTNGVVTGARLELDNAGPGTVIENTVFRAIPGCGAIDGATGSMVVRNDAFFQVAGRFCGTDRSDGGNLDVDCRHVDPAAGDWRLQPGSPCIDAGAASSDRDVDGSPNDIGVYGGPMSQGGGW